LTIQTMQKRISALCPFVSAPVWPCLQAFSKPRQCGLRFLPGLLALLFLQRASAAIPMAADIQTPRIGDHALHILSPNLLELVLVNTKQPDPENVNLWDWVDDQQNFVPPDVSSVKIIINGQTNNVSSIGFKRRPL